jgi:glycosyltransferase involved in cell wall biosynthesis
MIPSTSRRFRRVLTVGIPPKDVGLGDQRIVPSRAQEDGVKLVEVHHFGPDPRRVGGIERVLNILVENKVGADRAVLHPTTARGDAKDFALSILKISRTVPRLPRDAVVHAHLSQGGSFLREGLAIILAHTFRIASVATIHGSRFVDFANTHPRIVTFILKRADAITCLSEETLVTVRRLAPMASVSIVANPVPTDPDSSSADMTSEIVLFAGELSERKGVDVLCRAWPLIAAKRQSAICILVGPTVGLSIPPLERMHIRAPVDFDGIRKLIRSARVVTLPSRNEGMPMILTEALSAGRPFVSTPVGGIPELANSSQPMVKVGDHIALADAIITLLQDPQIAKQLGEEGRTFHAQTRSVEAVGEVLRSIYLHAMSSKIISH